MVIWPKTIACQVINVVFLQAYVRNSVRISKRNEADGIVFVRENGSKSEDGSRWKLYWYTSSWMS